MKQLIVGSALMTASYLVYYLLCSLVACLLASYLLISVNKPHSLWSALLTASYLLSVLSTEFIPHTKLSDNLICILPCGLQIWLVGKIQNNQHLESAYYPPQSANLHFTRALGPSISGLDSLVFSFSSRIIILFTIILTAYVTNSVAAVSAEFLSLLLLNDF